MKSSIRKLALTGALASLLAPMAGHAASCTPFLPKPGEGAYLLVSTMNRNGSASYIAANMYQGRTRVSPSGPMVPALLTQGDSAPQIFSDRVNSANSADPQPFAVSQADKVSLVMTMGAVPQVTLTLLSWHNAKATFSVTCEASGIMYGSTTDVDYLIFLRPVAPIQ